MGLKQMWVRCSGRVIPFYLLHNFTSLLSYIVVQVLRAHHAQADGRSLVPPPTMTLYAFDDAADTARCTLAGSHIVRELRNQRVRRNDVGIGTGKCLGALHGTIAP